MKLLTFAKKHVGVVVALATTIIIMWTMFWPGYILSLDMVFAPSFHYSHTAGDFLNAQPLNYAITFLYEIFPGWVVQKLILASMFFLLSYLSFTYLPAPKRFLTKLFVSLLYTANLFVYERMLAGQWTHVYAYALLPLFLHCLILSTQKPRVRSSIYLALTLVAISILSLHIFIMACLITLLWYGLKLFQSNRKNILKYSLISLLTLLVLTSYWTIPAVHRTAPVEASFAEVHWQAFAAAPHGHVPTILNLVALGGFWGEAHPWANYFAWPQNHMVFWISWALIVLSAGFGLYTLLKSPTQKKFGLFITFVGIAAVVFATGASASPFQPINLFAYHHVFFWSGFRDSQKFIAFFALSLITLAGYGFDRVFIYVENQKKTWSEYAIPLLFLIPAGFGLLMWGGLSKQLRPVFYPASWQQAQAILQQNEQAKALILPWEGYFSLKFANNLIVANPAQAYFGTQAIASQNFRLGGIYDQTDNPQYSELDQTIQNNNIHTTVDVASVLKKQGIGYVIFFQDIISVDIFKYPFLSNQEFKKILDTPEVAVYKID